jgi:hypothetical protein
VIAYARSIVGLVCLSTDARLVIGADDLAAAQAAAQRTKQHLSTWRPRFNLMAGGGLRVMPSGESHASWPVNGANSHPAIEFRGLPSLRYSHPLPGNIDGALVARGALM